MKSVDDELEKRAWFDAMVGDYVILVTDVKAMLGVGTYKLKETEQ